MEIEGKVRSFSRLLICLGFHIQHLIRAVDKPLQTEVIFQSFFNGTGGIVKWFSFTEIKNPL